MDVDQHSVAGSTAGHALDGSRRCKRCSHSKRDSHANSDADRNHNTCSFLCIHVPRRSDDMCCIKHYSDQNSDSVRPENISLENITSPKVLTQAGRERSPSGTSDGGGRADTVELVDSSSGAVGGETHAPSHGGGDKSLGDGTAGKPGSGGTCGGDDDDEDSSNSATSMLRNKKKPRSRLKKFLTSLLSLSSSSSDEEH